MPSKYIPKSYLSNIIAILIYRNNKYKKTANPLMNKVPNARKLLQTNADVDDINEVMFKSVADIAYFFDSIYTESGK